MKDKKYDRGLEKDTNSINETDNYIIPEELDETIKCDEEIEKESSNVFGVVTNCIKLNVRNKPEIGSTKICTIWSDTKVMIDLKESTDEWYKVYLSEGINGFCMKKYISIN